MRAAFDDVVGAAQDANRLVNEAEGYRNEILPGARAEAVELIEAANGYREAQVAESTGEAQRFLALEQEYRRAPEVTEQRLYLETMESVLPSVEKVIIEPGAASLLPYLPLGARRGGGQEVKRLILLIVAALGIVLGFLVAGSYGLGPVVVTREGEQKIILTLGKPRAVTQPGIVASRPAGRGGPHLRAASALSQRAAQRDPDPRPGGPGGRQLRRLAHRGSRAVLLLLPGRPQPGRAADRSGGARGGARGGGPTHARRACSRTSAARSCG